ncbi:MAG TPA: glycosyltransferase family A protein [Chlamydiales bacterium]|nr:glycosyltransferase family A protein [Chlamydiales bacterium]
MYKLILCLFLFTFLHGGQIPDKVLICGIGRNIEKAVPNTIQSATELGSRFADYRVIFYENNSTDQTKKLLQAWADKNPKVLFQSEKISKRRIAKQLEMKVMNRTEAIARARNVVLDIAMKRKFDDYKYVVWADLDFLEPWDVDAIVETILHPQQEWDAVFAYGGYDLFALRTPEWPIGFELIGPPYFEKIEQLRKKFVLDRQGPWKKVYSAFGGIGIYKREALKGCRYSGVVTKDLEAVTLQWLGECKEGILFYQDYQELLAKVKPIDLTGKRLENRGDLPDQIGVRIGKVVWFSCTPNTTIPWTCEHVPLHASMILRGHDKLFINPKIRCGF